MKQRNELAYSALTDEIFYVDGRGQKKEIKHNNWFQMMLLWLNDGILPKVGSIKTRTLSVEGNVKWKITCERVAE